MSITSKIKSIDIQEALDKRFCDLVFSLLGKKVKIILDGETQAEGLLYTINPTNGGIILRDYSEKKANGEENNCALKRLEKKDFAFLFAENVDDPPFVQDQKNLNNKQSLRTDGEITKATKDTTRKLQAVDFDFESKEGLEDLEGLGSQKDKKKFNQFEVNQQKFGVGTDYKDEFYTTKLDYSKLDQGQIEQAERLEKEIKTESSTNQHVLIDRGHDYLMHEAGSDEEKHFSAVHGSGMYNNDGKVISRSSKKEDTDSKQSITFGQGRPTFSNDKKETSATKKTDNIVQQLVKTDSNNQATKLKENKEEPPKKVEQLKETDKKDKDKKPTPIFVEKKQDIPTVAPVEEKAKIVQASETTKAPETNSQAEIKSADVEKTVAKDATEVPTIAAPPNLSAPATTESLPAAQGQPKKKLQLKKKTDPEFNEKSESKPPNQPPVVDNSQQARNQFNQYPSQTQEFQYMQQQQQQQHPQFQQYPQYIPDVYGTPIFIPNQIGISQGIMAPGFPQQPIYIVSAQQNQQMFVPQYLEQPNQQQQHQQHEYAGQKKNLKYEKNRNFNAE